MRTIAIVFLVLTGVVTYYFRIRDFEPHRAFMTDADKAAMEWIKANTNQDAVFGVNTNFLNPTMPYGTDAGYWLPVYAERRTTALTLLASLSNDYQFDLEQSKTIVELYKTQDINQLCDYGIDYLYSGAKDPLGSKDLAKLPSLLENDNIQLIYEKDSVQVFKVCD